MRGTETVVGAKPAARRLGRVLVGRRRRAAVLLLALAYTAAMLMLTMGGGEGFGSSGVVEGALGPPGSVYRSHLVFERLLPEMRAFASRGRSRQLRWSRIRSCRAGFGPRRT